VISKVVFLQAVERIRGDLTPLLGETSEALVAWLDGLDEADSEAVDEVTTQVLALLTQHPEARARVVKELDIGGQLEQAILLGYEPGLGEDTGVEGAVLMVCPEDPSHYQRYLQQKGQRLYCPQHGVPLVPAGSKPEEA
jgi:hypothetical protein